MSPFQCVLALFLLEMGIVADRRLEGMNRVGPFLLGFGIVAPLLNGALGVYLSKLTGLQLDGATLPSVFSASASYITAPPAIHMSLPDANPTFYLTSALAITFRFNITLGIPIYLQIARKLYL